MHSEYIPDIDLFVRMHVLKEATQSNRIEGTQTNLDEALRRRADVATEKRDDWEEVQNYVAAMNKAVGQLETLPFSANQHKDSLDNGQSDEFLPGCNHIFGERGIR